MDWRDLQPIEHAAHEGAVKVTRGGGGRAIFFYQRGEKETRIQEEFGRPEIGEDEVRAQAPRTPGRRPIGDKQIAQGIIKAFAGARFCNKLDHRLCPLKSVTPAWFPFQLTR